jgi:transcriptional regulator with XRE-family HTH domain
VTFGQRLRRLRQDAELSGKQLAELLGWPASKVSRLEHGVQTASVADVEAWATVLGIDRRVRDLLVEDLRSLRVEYATWRRQTRSGLADRQRVGHVIEDGTSLQRTFQSALVPGLLQTSDYARAVFAGVADIYGKTDVEAAVRARMERQDALYLPERSNVFVVTEGALRTRIGSPAVHRAQLARLQALDSSDTVELAVLTWSSPVVRAPLHGFVMFDDRLVLVETFTAELALREPDDIALYARLFDLYSEAALHGAEATAFIARIARELS